MLKDLENYLLIAEESICRTHRHSKTKEKALSKCKGLLRFWKKTGSNEREKHEMLLLYREELQKIKPQNMFGDYFYKFMIERAQNETGIKRLSRQTTENLIQSIAI